MSNAIEIIVFIAGISLVLLTLNAVIKTVIVPRAENLLTNRIFLRTVFWIFTRFIRFVPEYERRDAFFARVAPTGLVLLPMIWAMGVALGCSGMLWALGTRPYVDALILSASSLTTLGIRGAMDNPSLAIVVVEALIGLALVALIVSYLPLTYSVFRDRELKIAGWSNRAGRPPEVENFIFLANEIGLLHRMDEEWQSWEHWFEAIGESHLSYPALNFFRSPSAYNSWITTAENVLDTASFIEAAVDIPTSIEGQLCIRSGFVALRNIATYFRIPYPKDPAPDGHITYSKEKFLQLYENLEKRGVLLKPDKEQAWVDFSGWRVNYDAVVVELEKRINIHK